MGHLPEQEHPEALASLSIFKQQLGFIPRVFREQLSRPDLVAVEARLIETLLFKAGALTRLQKEFIILAV